MDVTEQKKFRQQGLLTAKLVTVGTLAAGIIHEINNPLAYIISNLHFINDKIIRLNKSEISLENFILKLTEVINDSVQGAERINKIVQDIRGYARHDEVGGNPIDVNKVLDTALDMAYPKYKYHASVEKELSADIPLLCFEEGRLVQVFLNIIINAAQSFDNDNRDNNVIRLKTSVEGRHVCIAISDTGSGISPENLQQIFEPFYTTKAVGVGTGLGLSICNEIIYSMGGEIRVSSEVNKGTSFYIYLPMHSVHGANSSDQR